MNWWLVAGLGIGGILAFLFIVGVLALYLMTIATRQ
jgi:hypothetical protein